MKLAISNWVGTGLWEATPTNQRNRRKKNSKEEKKKKKKNHHQSPPKTNNPPPTTIANPLMNPPLAAMNLLSAPLVFPLVPLVEDARTPLVVDADVVVEGA